MASPHSTAGQAAASSSGGRQQQQHFLWGRVETSDSKTPSSGQSSDLSSGRLSESADVKRKLRRRSVQPEEVVLLHESSSNSLSTPSGNAEATGGAAASSSAQAAAAAEGPDFDDDEEDSDLEWDAIEVETGNPTTEERDLQRRAQRAAKKFGPTAVDLRVKASVPKTPDGRSSSVGSAAHAAGSCTACIAIYTKAGCLNGVMCHFCHMPHKRPRRKLRPCKGKRERYRKLVERLRDEVARDPENVDIASLVLPPSVARDDTSRAKLIAQLREYRAGLLKLDRGGGAAPELAGLGHREQPDERMKIIVSL